MDIYDMNSCNAKNYIVKKLKNNKDTIILEFCLLNDFTKYTNIPTYHVALQIYKRSLIPLGYTLNTSSGYSYLYKDIKRK